LPLRIKEEMNPMREMFLIGLTILMHR
jgi:hypothetical protein